MKWVLRDAFSPGSHQEVNSTWYPEIEEPIKSCEKHYSLVLYILTIIIVINTFSFSFMFHSTDFVPPIRVEPSVAEILLGEDIDLTCYSDGLETVLRWDKRVDGVYTRVADSMVTYTKHSNLNQVKSVLSIRDAQYLDSAAYRCTLVSVNGQRRTAHGNAIVKGDCSMFHPF